MKSKPEILVVDDERIVRESLFHWFKNGGYAVATAASGAEALEKMAGRPAELLFVDVKMPGMNGIELLERIKAEYPAAVVVIITAYGSIESAVEAMKKGASDYLIKPFKPEYLTLVMEKIDQQLDMARECNYLKAQLEKKTRFENIIGRSAPMQAVFDTITQVADQDTSVLLTGETGTGKELVAKAIHAKSRRAHHPFVALNCGAMPENLLETELFGHQKGAFTGATHPRKGFLEVVSGGTLFLDEIGEIGMKMQIDLLRVLEERRISRVGSSQTVPVDFRLITATCKDLEKEIAAGRFREDFFYRIHVIRIAIPPLRERKEDIPLLARHFLSKISHETGRKVDHISQAALKMLQGYRWRGNVRELENAIERAVVLSTGPLLGVDDFAFLHAAQTKPAPGGSLLEMEKGYIRQVLDDCAGNITRAAAVLGINRVTLHRKIKRLQLSRGPQR
ncbi:MAG: sigma-54 dependent transcriptional regulator [Desulfobacteraceae bacterium]|nr:sigma-54 dependent transcriptional regulator [Desulfobacteraceae bacterium]